LLREHHPLRLGTLRDFGRAFSPIAFSSPTPLAVLDNVYSCHFTGSAAQSTFGSIFSQFMA